MQHRKIRRRRPIWERQNSSGVTHPGMPFMKYLAPTSSIRWAVEARDRSCQTTILSEQLPHLGGASWEAPWKKNPKVDGWKFPHWFLFQFWTYAKQLLNNQTFSNACSQHEHFQTFEMERGETTVWVRQLFRIYRLKSCWTSTYVINNLNKFLSFL